MNKILLVIITLITFCFSASAQLFKWTMIQAGQTWLDTIPDDSTLKNQAVSIGYMDADSIYFNAAAIALDSTGQNTNGVIMYSSYQGSAPYYQYGNDTAWISGVDSFAVIHFIDSADVVAWYCPCVKQVQLPSPLMVDQPKPTIHQAIRSGFENMLYGESGFHSNNWTGMDTAGYNQLLATWDSIGWCGDFAKHVKAQAFCAYPSGHGVGQLGDVVNFFRDGADIYVGSALFGIVWEWSTGGAAEYHQVRDTILWCDSAGVDISTVIVEKPVGGVAKFLSEYQVCHPWDNQPGFQQVDSMALVPWGSVLFHRERSTQLYWQARPWEWDTIMDVATHMENIYGHTGGINDASGNYSSTIFVFTTESRDYSYDSCGTGNIPMMEPSTVMNLDQYEFMEPDPVEPVKFYVHTWNGSLIRSGTANNKATALENLLPGMYVLRWGSTKTKHVVIK